jgi:DnaJ like chaperone protein
MLVVYLFFYRSPGKKSSGNEKLVSRRKGKNTYAKWIGGTLGWAFGGPIGALLGFAFGKMYEDMNAGTFAQGGTQQSDFNVSLLVLTAAVMKADGVVKRAELDFVKRFFLTNFGKERAEQYVLMLREILKQEIRLAEVGGQIRQFMDYPSRLQLMHYLFGVALADGQLAAAELQTLTSIGGYLGLSPADFNSIKAMFVKEVDSAYKILEIDPNASDEVVKKAYRDMAFKYHPDKLSHLGEEVHRSAEKKFQEVSAAYDQIKKQRGMK